MNFKQFLPIQSRFNPRQQRLLELLKTKTVKEVQQETRLSHSTFRNLYRYGLVHLERAKLAKAFYKVRYKMDTKSFGIFLGYLNGKKKADLAQEHSRSGRTIARTIKDIEARFPQFKRPSVDRNRR